MFIAILAAVAIVALVVQNERWARRLASSVAQERARQDLLLNRLASRTPGEYVALTQTLAEPTIQHTPAGRHLYDPTGLIHDEVFDVGAED